MVNVNRAESASTSMVWQFRSTDGSAQISIVVRSGPIPASDRAAATLTLAGKPGRRLARSAAEHPLGRVEALDRNAVRHQIGRAGQPARRLAGGHAHRRDLALGGGRDRIEPEQRAGRHDDLAAVLPCEIDQMRAAPASAPALSTITALPASSIGRQMRSMIGGRRAFDGEVGMGRETRRARPADSRCPARRARPAPWRGRGRPRRRASDPACRRGAGAQARGRWRRGRRWRRGSWSARHGASDSRPFVIRVAAIGHKRRAMLRPRGPDAAPGLDPSCNTRKGPTYQGGSAMRMKRRNVGTLLATTLPRIRADLSDPARYHGDSVRGRRADRRVWPRRRPTHGRDPGAAGRHRELSAAPAA